ncbi:MAG: hypothetical protein AB7U82_34920 [Blastocatellales bacterium]
MATPQEYVDRLNELFGARGGVHFEWNNVFEARQNLTALKLIQQQLRTIKKEIGLEMTAIRDVARQERVKIGSGIMSGLAGGLFGRGNVNRINAARKRDLTIRQEALLEPFKSIKAQMDSILIELDHLKVELQAYIEMNK